mgnify:FL=1
MKKFIKNNWLILLIIVVAFILRLWALNYGLPNFFIGDEQSIAYGAYKMVELKTLIPALNPSAFRPMYYPPLLSYIYLIFLAPVLGLKYLVGGFVGMADFKNYLILNPTITWLTIRLISVLFGAATIFITYLAGKKLFGKIAGLYAAAFLALSLLHLQLSHFARHWVPATFFVALIIYLSICIFFEPKKIYYVLVGIIAGLGFGVSYITCVTLVVFGLAHLLAAGNFWPPKNLLKKIADKNFWLTILIFLALAIIFILLHPQEFTRILFGEDSGAGAGKSIGGLFAEFWYHFKNLINFEPLLLAAAIFGSFILFLKSKKKLLLLLSLPITYIIALYLFFHSEVRYIILVLPALVLPSGFAAAYLQSRLKFKFAPLLIILFFFSYPFALAGRYDYLLSKKDNRILAPAWIANNIEPSVRIATKFEDIQLTPTKQAILDQRAYDHQSLRQKDYALLKITEDSYPAPAYKVLPLYFIEEKVPPIILDNLYRYNYKYYAVEFWSPAQLSDIDKKIINSGTLIKEFSNQINGQYILDINGNYYQPVFWLFKIKQLGPSIQIYQL